MNVRRRLFVKPCRGCSDVSWHTAHLTWLGYWRYTDVRPWSPRVRGWGRRETVAALAWSALVGQPFTAGIDAHVHEWRHRQNVTSGGTLMPAIRVCACGAAEYAPAHCATCTCLTPPQDPS